MPEETATVPDQNNDRGNTEGMRVHRVDDRTTGKISNRVAQSTPGAKREAKHVERTKTKKMRTLGIHRGHSQESTHPDPHAPGHEPDDLPHSAPEIIAPAKSRRSFQP